MPFLPAQRRSVKPLIGLFGESGGGKTFSALLIARGIVGPAGKIGLIDTENGRGSLYVDMIPGGYDVLDMDAPFSPEAYTKAIEQAEKAGIECLVVDSTTHEWNGEGGYLDMKESALDRMAGNDWKKRDACKFAAAAQCKPEHTRFVQRLLRAKCAVILCFRAKMKVKMGKVDGRTKVESDEHVSPISDTGLIFEMLIAGEVYSMPDRAGKEIGGFFRCTKHTHPDLLAIMPPEDRQIGSEFGSKLAHWASGAKQQPVATKPASQPPAQAVQQPAQSPPPATDSIDPISEVKARIRQNIQGKFATMKEFQQHCWDEAWISDTESLAELSLERLQQIEEKTKSL